MRHCAIIDCIREDGILDCCSCPRWLVDGKDACEDICCRFEYAGHITKWGMTLSWVELFTEVGFCCQIFEVHSEADTSKCFTVYLNIHRKADAFGAHVKK